MVYFYCSYAYVMRVLLHILTDVRTKASEIIFITKTGSYGFVDNSDRFVGLPCNIV